MPLPLRKFLHRRRALLIVGLVILVWVFFLDSHSVLNRIRWHREAEHLSKENQKIEAVIARSKEELSHRNDAQEIERIARESYGMRREGETVYRVKDEGD